MYVDRETIFVKNTREELIPDATRSFPYMVSLCQVRCYPDQTIPWHWHKTLELIYVARGELEFRTAKRVVLLPAGCGLLVNTGVLHASKGVCETEDTEVLVHQFDASILGGQSGSIFDRKYMQPFLTNRSLEIIPFFQNNRKHQRILNSLRDSFDLDPEKEGYEFQVRIFLSALWLQIMETADFTETVNGKDPSEQALREMLIYIQERFSEQIKIRDLAEAGMVSERECYRLFSQSLHMTPGEYLRQVRLTRAASLLAETDQTVTAIGMACGFGSASYFGRLFLEAYGLSPSAWRDACKEKWQNSERCRQD